MSAPTEMQGGGTGRGREPREERPRINLRPLLFVALGLFSGILFYHSVRFGSFRPSDLCFLAVFLALALVPLGRKRVPAVLLAVLLSAGVGVGVAHLSAMRYGGVLPGRYVVSGTVETFVAHHGYVDATLTDLSFDGEGVGGKLTLVLSSDMVRPGDVYVFEANVAKLELSLSDSYAEYLYCMDIRYDAGTVDVFQKTGESENLLLRAKGALYDRLAEGMDKHEAEVCYALLTGDSRGIDRGLKEEVQTGGIAHIFAVSGLHIGILFGAVMFLCKPLGRKAFFPAIFTALLYTAFCNFSVSAVRALLMCGVLGGYRVLGRKYDFLQSISFAAILILLFSPRDALSAGFRLSFGACLGLALFSGTLRRAFLRCRLPAPLAGYFSANLSVQLFTAPVLMSSFGYFSVWGFVLNLLFIPLLPVYFLTLLLFSAAALIIPPASVLFAVPGALTSAMLLFFALGDFGLVLTGFSLGMGATVWVIGCLVMTERVRLRPALRAVAGGTAALLFSAVLVMENVVFSGVRAEVFSRDEGAAVLLRAPSSAVLVIDGDIESRELEDILARNYGGTLDAVLVLSAEETDAVNHAAHLPAEKICARDERETGLRTVPVYFAEELTVGEMQFTFVTREKLLLSYCGVTVEVDFEGSEALGADLFIDGSHDLQFTLGNGIIEV